MVCMFSLITCCLFHLYFMFSLIMCCLFHLNFMFSLIKCCLFHLYLIFFSYKVLFVSFVFRSYIQLQRFRSRVLCLYSTMRVAVCLSFVPAQLPVRRTSGCLYSPRVAHKQPLLSNDIRVSIILTWGSKMTMLYLRSRKGGDQKEGGAILSHSLVYHMTFV